MKLNHFGKLSKQNGKLVYVKDSQKKGFEEFTKNLNEGAIVEIFMEETMDDGSLAQLAKCHAMTRELSIHTGYSFEDTKTLLKEKAGLCLLRNVAGREYFLCKSLGDCDKIELSAYITAAIELGEEVNHPVY